MLTFGGPLVWVASSADTRDRAALHQDKRRRKVLVKKVLVKKVAATYVRVSGC